MKIKPRKKAVDLPKQEALRFFLNRGFFLEDVLTNLPDSGAWVQVTMPPSTEIYIPYLGIFYATTVPQGECSISSTVVDYVEFNDEGNRVIKEMHPRMFRIQTEVGHVHMYPHEVRILRDGEVYQYLEDRLLREEHVRINWMNPQQSHFTNADRLHYIQSRGIPLRMAYQMLLGEINSPNVCYLTFHEEYQKMLAGVGAPSLKAREIILAHIARAPQAPTKEQYEAEEQKRLEAERIRSEAEQAAKKRRKEEERRVGRSSSEMLHPKTRRIFHERVNCFREVTE